MKVKVHPLKNLATGLFSIAKNFADPLAAMQDLLKLPKDKHGNILIGVDDRHFKLWNTFLKNLAPSKVFGPIMILTDESVIKAVLNKLKSDPDGFDGNASSDMIRSLVGGENIFAAQDSKTHAEHKAEFKNYLSDMEANIEKVYPIITVWLQDLLAGDGKIDDASLEKLCASIMLQFLLNEAAAYDERLIDEVIAIKQHFIDLATMSKLNKSDKHYDAALAHINQMIAVLHSFDSSSYPAILAKNGYDLAAAQSHITSLFMVGFDNLRSTLGSLLINFASQASVRKQLAEEVQSVGGAPFIQLDQTVKTPDISSDASKKFFKESTRLVPPVWLQARKNGDQPIELTYKNAQGEEVSFTVHPRTTIVMPNFHLLRTLENGQHFDTERAVTSTLPMPFSTGPNACPGRNIGFATAGVLLGMLSEMRMTFDIIKSPRFNPKVSLTLENLELKFKQDGNDHTQDIQSLPSVGRNIFSTFFRENASLVAAAGTGAAAMVGMYYETESLLFALGAGTATAGLIWSCIKDFCEIPDDEPNLNTAPRFCE